MRTAHIFAGSTRVDKSQSMHSEEEKKKRKKNHNNNKYKNISWQNQAFHCRTTSPGETRLAAHQQHRPALLLKEISPHSFTFLLPSPLCLQTTTQDGVWESSSRSEAAFCSSTGTCQTLSGTTLCQTIAGYKHQSLGPRQNWKELGYQNST